MSIAVSSASRLRASLSVLLTADLAKVVADLWQKLMTGLFELYRPELHDMRGARSEMAEEMHHPVSMPDQDKGTIS
jgi:hypothetical protein